MLGRKKLKMTNGLAYFAALLLLNKICFYRAFKGDRKSFPETNSQAYFTTLSGLEKFCLILIPGACTMKLLCLLEKKLASDKRSSLFCCFIIDE
jgi:hypothetical protein